MKSNMRTFPASFVLCASLAGAGCAGAPSLTGTSLHGNSDKQNNFGNNELTAAKQAEDVKALSAACKLEYRVSTSSVRSQACAAAMDILISRSDLETLRDICNLKQEGQAYEKWQNREKACAALR